MDTHSPPAQTVFIVVSGGLEHGGGIGRQMGYFLQARQDTEQRLRYRVIDSRGPWYLGASPPHIIGSIAYFGRAILILSRACFSSPCVAHVNIAGRGSTIRKLILLTIGRAFGLRYVLHVHDYNYAEYYRGQRKFLQKLITTMFRRAETVVVLGRRDLELVSQTLQLSKDRMVVLHNAVPDPGPSPDRRPIPGKPCQLLFLGYLSARKGVAELLKALASPAVKHLRWQATLAGDGPIDEYRALAKDLGILDSLSFPGWVDERRVSELCTGADVLVLPSYAEGLAMSVLEGLSHGLAVITTPVGAHLEVIEPEVSGILVPPGDIAALGDALVRVIEDESLRTRLSRGARARFLEKFDARRYVARLEQLHADLFAPQHDHPKPVEKGLIP
ncbi:glycosyltransferase family 4 protein [Bradyrhizobium canariense]|uniref:glycosyltransferase family 4 protein n=1 Tax=Bradyrhizobium canariense TaxID=255045 RepID=UPI0011BA4C98|nr:glycosyltransferase family 4 protein [Bradyrhizobium canariense]